MPHLAIVLNPYTDNRILFEAVDMVFQGFFFQFFEKLGTKICQDLNFEIWDTCYLDESFEGLKNKNKPWVQSNIFVGIDFSPLFRQLKPGWEFLGT